jgi:hypothetical protein
VKKILTSAILFGILVVVAQAVNINPNIPYNPAISQKPSDTPGGIIANFYQFSLLIGGLLALGAIVYGATKYTLAAGNPSGQGDAKDQILQALLGLLLLVGAYLVLNILNPDLVNLRLPKLEALKAPPSGEITPPRPPGPIGPGLEDADARRQLQGAGITISPRAGSLDGTQQNTIDEAIRLKQASGCPVQVNSTTGGFHPGNLKGGQCNHANGYKIDVQRNACLDSWITNQSQSGCSYVGVRSDDGAKLYNCGGAIYAQESGNPGHWDIAVCQ